jgi:SAM-dependent methyltransferase
MEDHPVPSPRGRVRALLLAAAKQRAAQALTLATGGAPSLFAPFSPSPTSVIDAVWKRLTDEGVTLRADELLVDLGCGDGRWLVSGVQQFGCRALGIELDPVLVRTAKEAVEAAGLQDRIEVVEADILKVPVRAARLVIVYAFAESLHGIREYLIEQLREEALVLSIGVRGLYTGHGHSHRPF